MGSTAIHQVDGQDLRLQTRYNYAVVIIRAQHLRTETGTLVAFAHVVNHTMDETKARRLARNHGDAGKVGCYTAVIQIGGRNVLPNDGVIARYGYEQANADLVAAEAQYARATEERDATIASLTSEWNDLDASEQLEWVRIEAVTAARTAWIAMQMEAE